MTKSISAWIPASLTLESGLVKLLPLEESHLETLEAIARDPRIWEWYPLDASRPEKFREAFRTAFAERDLGNQYPFAIFYKPAGKLIGSTRLLDIRPVHRKLEIGWTWLDPAFWGSGANRACKLLLLTACFETLGAVRVQLKTDVRNLRSRHAIEKIGGVLEGILRNDMILDDGTLRNSAYFSITEAEWPAVKERLEAEVANIPASIPPHR